MYRSGEKVKKGSNKRKATVSTVRKRKAEKRANKRNAKRGVKRVEKGSNKRKATVSTVRKRNAKKRARKRNA